MTESRQFRIRVMCRAAGLGAIVCAGILLVSGRWDVSIGFVVGTCISIMNFHLMAGDISKALSVRAGKASGVAAGRYFLRFITLGLLLVLLFTRTHIHVASTLAGLLSVQAVIYLWEVGAFVAEKIVRKDP
ncbi:MAG: ATP synthase subunit I [Candidatus Latescibacterota bacterium]